MAPVTTTRKRPRELAHRTADGIDVTLLWSSTQNVVTVAVYDFGADQYFEIEVPGEHALDAFHHPYVYAAAQDIEYRVPALEAA